MVQAEGGSITISGSPPSTRYARRYRQPGTALAYAPVRRTAAPVRAWQANPVVRPQSQWPFWP